MKIQVTFEIDEAQYRKDQGVEEGEEFDIKESFEELVFEKMDKPKWGVEVVEGSFKKIVVASGADEDEDDEDEIYYDDDFSSEEEIPADVDDLLEYFTELSEEIHEDYKSDFIRACAEDEDDLPDGGWTDTINVKRGSRTFELEIEFETEWCGDWSVRANLASDYTILSVKETTVKA
jgi:hypothetical protein